MKILVVGSTNMDISVRTPHFPLPGETLFGSDIAYKNGGKGANQACACAKLGQDTTFLTCVGDDSSGHSIIQSLQASNLDVSHVKYDTHLPTGSAIIMVDDQGQNEIVVIPGSNMACDPDYIYANEEVFQQANFVILQYEIPTNTIETCIRLANKHGCKIVLNPAPANNLLDKSLFPLIDYITPNETEAEILTGIPSSSPMDAARSLHALGIKQVIITLGSEGSLFYRNETDTYRVKARKVHAIDTVAAGDCFNGAFVCGLCMGYTEKEAMEFASCASAIAVTRRGAQESIPSLEEVIEMMKQ